MREDAFKTFRLSEKLMRLPAGFEQEAYDAWKNEIDSICPAITRKPALYINDFDGPYDCVLDYDKKQKALIFTLSNGGQTKILQMNADTLEANVEQDRLEFLKTVSETDKAESGVSCALAYKMHSMQSFQHHKGQMFLTDGLTAQNDVAISGQEGFRQIFALLRIVISTPDAIVQREIGKQYLPRL